MRSCKLLIEFLLLISLASSLSGYDPSPLQDYCAATNDTKCSVFVNGKFCKDPEVVTAKDFYYSGFDIPSNTSNRLGSNATLLTTDKMPGLNTQGVTMFRHDYAPDGVNPPHHHPRSSELIMVVKGKLLAGWVTFYPNFNKPRLFYKILNPGDLFMNPYALIHFQLNIGKTHAVAFSAHSSQELGYQTIPNALFATNPSMNLEVLAKSLQLDKKLVKKLQRMTWVT